MRGKSLHDEIGLNKVVSSLLAEVPRESDSVNIAKLHMLRAELHDVRGERDEAIAAYEDAMSLQPNDIQPVAPLARLYRDSDSEKAFAFHEELLPRLVEANRNGTHADFRLGYTALKFAEFYDEQGDAEKCWQAFEIAMENAPDGFLAAQIRRMSGRFSGISQKSAFKALTAAPSEAE